MSAQTPANIMYVRADGKYTNDGKSWATAKNNIQDAINYMVANKMTGEVWVGAGTYRPTESTESTVGSTQYMAFKIPAGITVRGGFPADGMVDGQYITRAEQRPMSNALVNSIGGFYANRTILTGATGQEASFVWDDATQQYNTTFYGNSYHVVWFAMNGFYPDGHAVALNTTKGEAVIEGCEITNGYAKTTETAGHPHEGYGGGVYMVKGSRVENCYIHDCEANRNGGGIYMDGGGWVEHSFVGQCQALGQGNMYGFGGGICLEDGHYGSVAEGMYPTVVNRTGMVGCVGRNGGGGAIYCNNPLYKNRLVMASVLIANNVALNEAGGLYCYQGGGVTQATIVRNKCAVSSGIATNGIMNGRSGGLYVRDFANVANTVVWGNAVAANRDVQFASSRSDSHDEAKKPLVRFSMLSRSDYADWSGVVKMNVSPLSDKNRSSDPGSSTTGGGFPAFVSPSKQAGYEPGIMLRSLRDLTSKEMEDLELPVGDDGRAYSWKVDYSSILTNHGLRSVDIDIEGLTPSTERTYDIVGQLFPTYPTLGGYSANPPTMTYWNDNNTWHVFIDQNYTQMADERYLGSSWNHPIRDLNDALHVTDSLVREAISKPTKVVFHLKEGNVNNRGYYTQGRVRNSPLVFPNMGVELEILGSYHSGSTGRDLTQRNPIMHPTTINGTVMNNYDYNASHMFHFEGVQDITIDGFHLRYANASSAVAGNTNFDGAAITLRNASNIVIKNVLVAHCTAERGAAVFAEGTTTASFENCIFHNNSTSLQFGIAGNAPSIIYAKDDAELTFDHCDVLRNVGYASWMDGSATNVWTNSVFYGNFNQTVEDTNYDGDDDEKQFNRALPAFGGETANASGSYCMFDQKSNGFNVETQFPTTANNIYTLSYVFDGGANSQYPRFINPTKNAGVSVSGDVTYYGRATSFEPHNTNPMVNAASTNGVPHPAGGTSDCWGKDFTCQVNRDFGGLPDVGAVENHVAVHAIEGENAYEDGQGYYGRTLYVRQYATLTEGGDGSSWQNAINGNAYYHEKSGTFLGDQRQKVITWTEMVDTYRREYDSAGLIKKYTPSTVQNPILYLMYNDGTQKYLKIENGVFSMVSNRDEATPVVIIGTNTALATFYDYQSGMYISNSSTKFTLSKTAKQWNNDYNNGKPRTTISSKSYYWQVENASATAPILSNKTTNTTWSYQHITLVKSGSEPVEHVNDNVTGINGLQYAVNNQSYQYSLDNISREVWVAAGTYSKDNETAKTGYFNVDSYDTPARTSDESCFVIRDGVDVYGAFPKVGNPGMEQRQALVSQYIPVVTDYAPADYETILMPITKTVASNASRRVLGQPYNCNPDQNKGAGFVNVDYAGATWDGFTLTGGVLDSKTLHRPNRNGGAGACAFKNVTLRNMVVCHNQIINSSGGESDMRAAGVYMDGGTMEGGYIINNRMTGWSSSTESKNASIAYGGGMYIYSGTLFNSVIANNQIFAKYADGAGAFIESANFFNNTIVNNNADYSNRGVGGVALYNSSGESTLNIYNSIIANNEGFKAKPASSQNPLGIGTKDVAVQGGGFVILHNCITETTSDESVDWGGKTFGSIVYDHASCQAITGEPLKAVFVSLGKYGDEFKTLNLRLAANSPAINKGNNAPVIGGVTYELSEYVDMDYTDRIKDCTIDLGAYEYDAAWKIVPSVVGNVASYYVTPLGRGTASATNPENAACADKLQKVLDAAGRYKYQNPGKRVIVRVATDGRNFEYYANRTTDLSNQDVRLYSIMVPKGVELWGGYSDAYTDSENHGFLDDGRDVTAHATYFDAHYYNKAQVSTVQTYHVFTFTDHVFDADGLPYLAGNTIGQPSTYSPSVTYAESDYMHIGGVDRAVLDGVFITNGNANSAAQADEVNRRYSVHQFGGAAVVEPYAHVRNCILENNAALYGGALALKDQAMVSGCLFRYNSANQGGAVYVPEDGTTLYNANIDYVIHTQAPSGQPMGLLMPKVYFSTIVKNNAQVGGGLWFTSGDPNLRVNSTVLWHNTGDDQPNVAGNYNPEIMGDVTSTIDFYPFAYSAVENQSMAGANNFMLNQDNKLGARFATAETDNTTPVENRVIAANTDSISFYGLTNYSSLIRTGMPVSEFNKLLPLGVSQFDFRGQDRTSAVAGQTRSYIEVGARALLRPFKAQHLMLRLYVAQPEDMNADVAVKMASMTKANVQGSYTDEQKTEIAEYYSQQGSSFAYPFQSLQDALDYIYLMRSTNEYNSSTYVDYFQANNMPFEIIIGRGTYAPSRDLSGSYGESLANTFAIPEGVSLYGGFRLADPDANEWYGRYVTPKAKGEMPVYDGTYANLYDLANCVNTIAQESVTFTADDESYTLLQESADAMMASRARTDVNKNNVIEPWEFEQQTILSGNATNATDKGVYHIVTIVPDQAVVGVLPHPQYVLTDAMKPAPDGYNPNELGQYIHFNGITFQGGRAHSYTSALDEMSKYNYYHGGAVLADGNRYNDSYNTYGTSYTAYNTAHGTSYSEEQWLALQHGTEYKDLGHTNAVGYRDAPISFASCRFYDNEAGYGGAISTNMEIELYQSSFEHNRASYYSDVVPSAGGNINVTYAGQGGAVFSTFHVTGFNTIFANNEATDLTHTDMTSAKYYSYRNHETGSMELPGTGGAIYSGLHGFIHLFNSNVVRNMANSYPAIFTMNPNFYTVEWAGGAKVESQRYNQITNTLLWGNELLPAAKRNPANAGKLFAAQLVVNYGAATRTSVIPYVPADNNPANQAELDDAEHDDNLTQKRYTEMLHFCAYEPGRGKTQKTENDFRAAALVAQKHTLYQYSHISDGQSGFLPYQNSNVVVVSDNSALDGPAFMRPSTEAGVAGYLESADWSPSRLNNLTDMGNTRLDQAADGSAFVIVDGIFQGTGSYWQARYMSQYPNYMHNLPLGDEPYMTLKQASTNNEMYRISLDPNPTHGLTYIDIGVYEYIHVQLAPADQDDVDVLWVSNYEKPENGVPNGSSWLQPTSDLQRAIETLLFSRNGHRKEIRLCDGTYSPIYTFAMPSGSLQTFMVDADLTGATDANGIVSLTIKGGYSREFQNLYSTTLYPAVLRQQARADQSSTKWDYLIYVKSATQHKTDVTNKIFPIHIQGVSLVNDQALSTAQGSALYYAESSLDSPTTSDATVTTSEPSASHTSATVTNPAKLILSNSIVMASTGASTVKIDPKGGSTLLYNNVFHSNAGKPLVASAATTVNNTFALNGGMVELGAGSQIKNSVLWRNNPAVGGSGYGYQLSLSGLSHDSGNTGDFIHNLTTADIFSNNAYTGGDVVDIEYDPGKGSAIPAHNYNVGLVNLNTDVTYGPNFIDPENTDVTLRRYNINPSMRLLNKGNNTFYNGVALTANTIIYDLAWEPTKMKDAASNHRLEAGTIDLGAYEYQYSLNRVLYVNPNLGSGGTGLDWEHALGAGNIQNAIDLAGVYASNEKKPAYVFVKAASASNPTMHTEEVLTLRNGVQIYGSIREDYMVECPYTLTDGVRYYEIASTGKTLLDAYVSDMLHYGRFGILSPMEGHTRILGINTNGTAFSTRPNEGDYLASVIDGFDVVPGSRGAAISAPALHINPFKADETPAEGDVKVVLRNIAVHGFTAQGCNVAEVNNALLYSTLMHHNTTTGGKAVLDLEQYGHLVNGTIEGKTTKASGSQVLNSLTNFDATPATYQTLTGYCYRMEDDNLNYQLTEQSPNIDDGNDALTALPDDLRGFVNYGRDLYTAEDAAEVNRLVGLSYLEGAIGGQKLKAVANQIKNADRDLLGNYRYQPDLTLGKNGNYIDRGAFETWRVDKDHQVVYPNYPYPGTSEYIMEGKSLVIDAPEDGGDATTAAHIPGFVLIQSGASLYGNGRELLISYGAVERKEKIGSEVIFSTPWHQSMIPVGLSDDRLNRTSGLFVVNYDGNGVMQMLHNNPTVYTYDGSKRMDWQHRMKPSESDCWVAVDPAVTPYLEANVGVYTHIEGATLPDGSEITIRCTAHGSSIHDYVYTEEVNDGRQQHVSKSIALHHYDDHQSTGGAADFTDEKNAGWNFIGYPYLTSQYQPYNKVSINHAQKDAMSVIVNDGSPEFLANTAPYAMDHAKTMWLWYDGVKGPDGYLVDGTGGFYSVNSWEHTTAAWHVKTDAEAVLRLGDGIFVQTHTLQENEELVFYRPVYTGASSSAPGRYYVGDEPEIEIVSPSAVGDAIRWEKVVRDDRVLLVQRDEDGVIRSAYDISGRRVQM